MSLQRRGTNTRTVYICTRRRASRCCPVCQCPRVGRAIPIGFRSSSIWSSTRSISPGSRITSGRHVIHCVGPAVTPSVNRPVSASSLITLLGSHGYGDHRVVRCGNQPLVVTTLHHDREERPSGLPRRPLVPAKDALQVSHDHV